MARRKLVSAMRACWVSARRRLCRQLPISIQMVNALSAAMTQKIALPKTPCEVRQVRAFNPFPGATAQIALNGQTETIKIWDAQALTSDAGSTVTPGTVVAVSDAGVEVACGVGRLRLLALQRPGGKRLSVSDFLRGCPLSAQQRFVLPPQKGAL